MTATMKKCPACASAVPAEATVCAHCRSKLMQVNDHWWKAQDGLLYPPWQHPDYKKQFTPPASRQPWTTKKKVGIAALLAVGVGWFAVAAAVPENTSDTLGIEACEEFADLRDIDLYTMDELREQVQQVYRDGRYADSSNIRFYSRLLVSTVTNGDTVAFGEAVEGMADACAAL